MNNCWCGNDDLKEYSPEYFKCSKCNTLISKRNFSNEVYNVEQEDADLYGKDYWEKSMTKAAGKDSLSEVIDYYLSDRVLYWLKYVLKYVKLGADVAEVGCGLGVLQYVLRNIGYEQVGFELSPFICKYVSEELNVKMHCGTFSKTDKRYDAVLAYDLFEHLNDPVEFVKACSESLDGNGIICLQTPCYDPYVTFEALNRDNGKFLEQLKAEQHIYLYSRESIQKILNENGFKYIVFEPAYFGDDFDMFLFASKEPIKPNSDTEIDDYLNSLPNGRIVKAAIALFDKENETLSMYKKADYDRTERLEQINELTAMLKESETDRADRLEQVNKLSEMLKESEADRADRLEQINKLSEMLKKSEEDRANRLTLINELTDRLNKVEESK